MKIKKIIFLVLLAAIILTLPDPKEIHVLATKTAMPVTLVIDAGHGGPDGGAVGNDGTLEADLNLAIAKLVAAEATRRGVHVILTRETQDGLYSLDNTARIWRKLEDMKRRKDIIEEVTPHAALSIHMNCFPQDPSVGGAQVFFPKSGNAEVLKESENIAKSVQGQLNENAKNGRNRVHMAKGNVYLLENPNVPIILVECGFLSNEVDLTKLKQMKYQKQIAACILNGVLEQLEI